MITTVVFDLDDTLYDEVDYCKSGFGAVAEFVANLPNALIARHVYDILWDEFTTGDRTKVFNAVLKQIGVSFDDNLISELVKVYRNHAPKITLPQQSQEVLDKLSQNYTLALLTDGFLPAQQLKVEALGIEKYFKCIIYTEQLGRNCWKPSPVGFEKLMKILIVEPQNACYVGDNEKKDFIAPNKLGMLTVQLNRPARVHTGSAPDADAQAQYVINDITQLPELLEKC